MSTILHITSREAWEASQASGRYRAPSLHSDGFLHCSKPDQVISIANFLFKGQTGLVLLCIDSEKVDSEIRYENLEGGEQLFPHIYGPINIDAVEQVLPFEPGRDGWFELPATLRGPAG